MLILLLMWPRSSFCEHSDSSTSSSLSLGMELLTSSHWFRKDFLESLLRSLKYFMGSSACVITSTRRKRLFGKVYTWQIVT